MTLSITVPQAGRGFPVGTAVEFSGTCDANITRIELVADGQFVLPTVTLHQGKWELFHRFSGIGKRKIVAAGLNSSGQEIASDSIEILIEDFGQLVKIPPGINPGVSKAKQQTMLQVFGKPGSLTEDCSAVTNPKIKALLVTKNVGPFAVTGIKPAVEALERIFAKVKKNEPTLHAQLGTAGMLCCRRIRTTPGKPPSKQFSNHSWGTAVDIKIKGSLDPRGDGKTQAGLLLLHPFFNEERFFWGAGFSGVTEDSMHFEASDELIKDWKHKNIV
jgi:hypothetical protein